MADRFIAAKLNRYVLLRVPTNHHIKIRGRRVKLLAHTAFAEMLGRSGVSIIDLEHQEAPFFHHVVSTFPAPRGGFLDIEQMDVILELPPGTLTQRTLIYAVHIHPENPKSADGQLHPALVRGARWHSQYMADNMVQGHHYWESRFQRFRTFELIPCQSSRRFRRRH